jgi:hypothetical protein
MLRHRVSHAHEIGDGGRHMTTRRRIRVKRIRVNLMEMSESRLLGYLTFA